MPRSRKLRRRLLAAYVLSYVPLSLAGDYTVASHGGMDWRREWVPACVLRAYRAPSGRYKVRITAAGVFYLPLVVVDRVLWHPTTYEGESSSATTSFAPPRWKGSSRGGRDPLEQPEVDLPPLERHAGRFDQHPIPQPEALALA